MCPEEVKWDWQRRIQYHSVALRSKGSYLPFYNDYQGLWLSRVRWFQELKALGLVLKATV